MLFKGLQKKLLFPPPKGTITTPFFHTLVHIILKLQKALKHWTCIGTKAKRPFFPTKLHATSLGGLKISGKTWAAYIVKLNDLKWKLGATHHFLEISTARKKNRFWAQDRPMLKELRFSPNFSFFVEFKDLKTTSFFHNHELIHNKYNTLFFFCHISLSTISAKGFLF